MEQRMGWQHFYESVEPLTEHDELPEVQAVNYIRLAAEVYIEYFDHKGQPDYHGELDHSDFLDWNYRPLAYLFENMSQPLIFKVGSKPIKAHEIRPLNITHGELAIYGEISLPPNFVFELTNVFERNTYIKQYKKEIFLINPKAGEAQKADDRAQEYTGIALDLEQIAENWRPENGGEITISS